MMANGQSCETSPLVVVVVGTEQKHKANSSFDGAVIILIVKLFKNGGCDNSLRLGRAHEQNLPMTYEEKKPWRQTATEREAERGWRGGEGCQSYNFLILMLRTTRPFDFLSQRPFFFATRPPRCLESRVTSHYP